MARGGGGKAARGRGGGGSQASQARASGLRRWSPRGPPPRVDGATRTPHGGRGGRADASAGNGATGGGCPSPGTCVVRPCREPTAPPLFSSIAPLSDLEPEDGGLGTQRGGQHLPTVVLIH